MSKYTYRMNLDNRKFLAGKIFAWAKGKKDNMNLRGLTYTLMNGNLFENEELEIWTLVWFELDGRRKSASRDDFMEKVNHAEESLRNPLGFEKSADFENLMTRYYSK